MGARLVCASAAAITAAAIRQAATFQLLVTLFDHAAQAPILISVLAHLPRYGPVCVEASLSLLDFQVMSGLAHDHVTATSVQIRQNHLAVLLPGTVCNPEAALLAGFTVHRRTREV